MHGHGQAELSARSGYSIPKPQSRSRVSVDLTLDPRLTLESSIVGFLGDTRLLRPAAAHPLAEAFDCAGIHAPLPEVLSRHVDLGPLAGAAERDVGVLAGWPQW